MKPETVMVRLSLKTLPPIVAAIAIALIPAPGLPQHAWYFFAIFAGVIVGLILEPLPGGAIGLIGVTLVTVLSPWVLFSPEELARPGFDAANAALTWALAGFSNSTVWLIFGAFTFALGYEKTGLGKRLALLLVKSMGRRTLTLGYAIALADLVLAPFTPSNTARSGGTLYPIIRNLPALYGSKPHDPTYRRIGAYVMWVAIASTCVTSSMFLTALAPNLLAVELTRKTVGVSLEWTPWFLAFAPVGVLLLVLVPLLSYWIYPPEVKSGAEVPAWAAGELTKMGSLTRDEILLGVLVVLALVLWIFATDFVNATTVALIVISLMLLLGVVTWDDVLADKAAWNTLAWFATLVVLAGGLVSTGFVKWFADTIATHLGGFSPTGAMVALVIVFYLVHYLFASVTAHVTAMLPVMLAAGSTIPGMNMPQLALLLCLTLGLMGIITPYGTGPSPVYYGSGYLPSSDWWRLGAIFGLIYLIALLVVGLPWVLITSS
jgi:L-tartrate/succinate antiporter